MNHCINDRHFAEDPQALGISLQGRMRLTKRLWGQ